MLGKWGNDILWKEERRLSSAMAQLCYHPNLVIVFPWLSFIVYVVGVIITVTHDAIPDATLFIIKAAIKIAPSLVIHLFFPLHPFFLFYYRLTMANPAGSNVVVDYEDISYKHEIKKGIRAFPRNAANYVIDLFPIFQWIHRYNLMVSEIKIRRQRDCQ